MLSRIHLDSITNNAGGAEEEEGGKPKSGLFSLPFMTRAAERQRLNAQQEAAAVLAQLEAEDEQAAAGSDTDVDDGEPNGWESGSGNAGRLTFGGGPVAPQVNFDLASVSCLSFRSAQDALLLSISLP